MSTNYLSADFVARYARPPSDTTVSQAISVHESVRDLLGDTEYATILQGSYKNDTALWDMNDVDIVAVSKGLVSCYFTGSTPTNGVPWADIFSRIEKRLQADTRYQGKWTREDKCIRLNTGVKVDIVPAVRIGDATADPIAIYSFRAGKERKNWPRAHFDAGAAKSAATNGAFKQTVRLLKRWSRCWFSDRKVAPSYYLECAVHAQPNTAFFGNLARDFVSVAAGIGQLRYGSSTLPRQAGEGNLLAPDEWPSAQFQQFQQTLHGASVYAQAALNAYSEFSARNQWVAAFNGQQP
ncbi:nucleotidyltransferase domain-containing protein [Sorangium sp. So ce1182]|uniref:nucleotidyltransferase domain-containing protein n=1 Tax=Sorangium sp. So ce1182 TaxID=3133334 RepID=UPI003F5D9CBF